MTLCLSLNVPMQATARLVTVLFILLFILVIVLIIVVAAMTTEVPLLSLQPPLVVFVVVLG